MIRAHSRRAAERVTWFVVLAFPALLAGACTGSSDTTEPPPAPVTDTTRLSADSQSITAGADLDVGDITTTSLMPAPELATTVNVTLADYAIAVTPRSVSAGNVTLSVVNEDSAPHNVVLVATDRAPGSPLPNRGSRRIHWQSS